MKKMIFSAVALVAFSFAGMANEIEENKVEEVSIERDCIAEAKAAIKYMQFLGADEVDVLYVAQMVRASCEASKQ
ncbi:hypothetical protein [Flavobacterium sp.]|uniref:hypothetical protein n=1 Tax=Flavobacterium sp. TaxID=239 RepID=UPI0040480415